MLLPDIRQHLKECLFPSFSLLAVLLLEIRYAQIKPLEIIFTSAYHGESIAYDSGSVCHVVDFATACGDGRSKLHSNDLLSRCVSARALLSTPLLLLAATESTTLIRRDL